MIGDENNKGDNKSELEEVKKLYALFVLSAYRAA